MPFELPSPEFPDDHREEKKKPGQRILPAPIPVFPLPFDDDDDEIDEILDDPEIGEALDDLEIADREEESLGPFDEEDTEQPPIADPIPDEPEEDDPEDVEIPDTGPRQIERELTEFLFDNLENENVGGPTDDIPPERRERRSKDTIDAVRSLLVVGHDAVRNPSGTARGVGASRGSLSTPSTEGPAGAGFVENWVIRLRSMMRGGIFFD